MSSVLSHRQSEVVLALAAGHTLLTAADAIGIAYATARRHFQAARRKLPGLTALARPGRPRKARVVEGLNLSLIAARDIGAPGRAAA